MTFKLNHTSIWCGDPEAGARCLAEILKLGPPTRFVPFHVVTVDNGVSLDFMAKQGGDPAMQHYAFEVGETEFDAILGRISERGLDSWADTGRTRKGAINRNDGGRGVYWHETSGHQLEIITRPTDRISVVRGKDVLE